MQEVLKNNLKKKLETCLLNRDASVLRPFYSTITDVAILLYDWLILFGRRDLAMR